jgi:DNA-binding phage protein
MPLTEAFSETIHEELRKSSFRRAYLRETMECLVSGEVETGKTLLRDYINGTTGFTRLSRALGRSSTSLRRMLGPKGNPSLRSFLEVTTYLQKIDGTILQVVDRRAARKAA